MGLSAHCHRRFFLSYTAPVMANLAMIATLILYRGLNQNVLAVNLAWGSLAGSALEALPAGHEFDQHLAHPALALVAMIAPGSALRLRLYPRRVTAALPCVRHPPPVSWTSWWHGGVRLLRPQT